MVALSLTGLLAGLALGLLALAGFAWAWRRGQFDRLDEQAHLVFEARDYGLDRPWESPAQQAQRRRERGGLEAPCPGEWGGAS